MSYCELFAFTEDGMQSVNEYKNSHGFLSFVWSALWDTYIGVGIWLSNPKRLWKIQEDPRLLRMEKIVFLSTFDYAMIKAENFEEYANLLDEFLWVHHKDGYVCHLSYIAQDIRKLIGQDDIKAIGFYGMSVSDNLWVDWDDEADEAICYSLKTGTKHWFVDFNK